jgi:carboxyl-terminal processing protease
MNYDVTDNEYEEFKKFLADKDYKYTTKTEEQLETLVKRAKTDKYHDLLKDELTKLKVALEKTKEADIETKKDEIKELLEYEIVKRYYFEKGRVEVRFDDDEDWAEAKSILLSPTKYTNLLTNS